jgi:hypothetical protein
MVIPGAGANAAGYRSTGRLIWGEITMAKRESMKEPLMPNHKSSSGVVHAAITVLERSTKNLFGFFILQLNTNPTESSSATGKDKSIFVDTRFPQSAKSFTNYPLPTQDHYYMFGCSKTASDLS